MDGGTWWVQSMGSQRVGHDFTFIDDLQYSILFRSSVFFKKIPFVCLMLTVLPRPAGPSRWRAPASHCRARSFCGPRAFRKLQHVDLTAPRHVRSSRIRDRTVVPALAGRAVSESAAAA